MPSPPNQSQSNDNSASKPEAIPLNSQDKFIKDSIEFTLRDLVRPSKSSDQQPNPVSFRSNQDHELLDKINQNHHLIASLSSMALLHNSLYTWGRIPKTSVSSKSLSRSVDQLQISRPLLPRFGQYLNFTHNFSGVQVVQTSYLIKNKFKRQVPTPCFIPFSHSTFQNMLDSIAPGPFYCTDTVRREADVFDSALLRNRPHFPSTPEYRATGIIHLKSLL